MTFKQATSAVSIWAKALDKLGESRHPTSIDDSGNIAAACRRWYKPVVARLLEMHHWGLATKRGSLVEITNTRSAEWTYAYSAPDDMAFPVGITLENGTGSVSYYRGLGGLIGMLYGRPIFQFHNGTLFAHITGDLDYVSYDITEDDFNATFENLVVLTLASQLALILPKDKGLSDDLKNEATTEINVAITHNLNTGRQTYGNRPSEAEMARGYLYGSNWDWFPRSPGEV